MNIPVMDYKLPVCARHKMPMVAHCVLCDAENAGPLIPDPRLAALEAECLEERAALSLAEDEVQRLREAIERHRERSYGLSLIPTAGRDFDLYAVLTPPESPAQSLGGLPIESDESLPPGEVRLIDHTGVRAKIVNILTPPEAQGREEGVIVSVDRAPNGDRAIETRAMRRPDGTLIILSTRDVTEERRATGEQPQGGAGEGKC